MRYLPTHLVFVPHPSNSKRIDRQASIDECNQRRSNVVLLFQTFQYILQHIHRSNNVVCVCVGKLVVN
jgi:hypothetical protein